MDAARRQTVFQILRFSLTIPSTNKVCLVIFFRIFEKREFVTLEENGEPVESADRKIDIVAERERKMVESDLSSAYWRRRAEALLQPGKFGKAFRIV